MTPGAAKIARAAAKVAEAPGAAKVAKGAATKVAEAPGAAKVAEGEAMIAEEASEVAGAAAKVAEAPGTAKVAEGAADEPTINVEAAVTDQMPELKVDLSFSEKSVPGSPSPEIELGEIVEPVEAVEMDPEPEQLIPGVVDAEHPYKKNQDLCDQPRLSQRWFPEPGITG